MMKNTFGHLYRLTSFGESHGPAMGGIIDGMPAGVTIDLERIQYMLNRRRPGQLSETSSPRNESDTLEVLSGIFEGRTLGTPIGFIVRNENARSADYDELRHVFRPSHADYTYQMKYGIRDHRGGGRASGRETVSRVVAGAFALQVLQEMDVQVKAYISQIGPINLTDRYTINDLGSLEANALPCPDHEVTQEMMKCLTVAREQGDSLGGKITCVASGLRPGLGEPVFGKLDAALAAAMMSIPAAKAFAIGDGMEMASRKGSEVLDLFAVNEYGGIELPANHSGGVLGGISTGDDIVCDVWFKPVPTLMCEINAIDDNAHPVTIKPHGRHDVCVVPRAVPVVEAMAAMVILDNLLLSKATI